MGLLTFLKDKFKNAPTVTSVLNLSALFVNSSGGLVKTNQVFPLPTTPTCADADSATPGWMKTDLRTLNLPASGLGGFIFTLQYDAVARTQFFYAWAPNIFVRKHSSGTGNDKWEGWHKTTIVAL